MRSCSLGEFHLIILLLDKFKLGGRGKSKKVAGGADVDGERGEGHHGVETEQRRKEEEAAEAGRRERERRQLLEGRMQSNPTSQRYLQWKETTLRLARDKLVETDS